MLVKFMAGMVIGDQVNKISAERKPLTGQANTAGFGPRRWRQPRVRHRPLQVPRRQLRSPGWGTEWCA